MSDWCAETVELDSRDPDVPAVIDCERQVVDALKRPRSHNVHTRTLELPGGGEVVIRWTRDGGVG